MPYMQTTRTLRQAPNGIPTLSVANIGDEVNILQESQGWAQVQFVGMVGTGWVLSNTIGDQSPIPPDSTIDRTAFFLTCWRVGLSSGVLPHYLAAVAQLRSGISNAQVGSEFGPYRFTSNEWDAARQTAAFGLTDLVLSDIQSWDLQCTIFAAMAYRDQTALTATLARQPSATALYLTQLLGPNAAAAALNTPIASIETDLNGESDADLPLGGMTRPQIMDRYAKYFRVTGAGSAAQQGQAAINLLITDLQTALDAVRNDIIAAGTSVLGAQPSTDTILTSSTQPPQPTLPAQPPAGPGAGGTPGSGGVLGALVAAHESGSAGYNAYNRGNAGDSAGKSMDFAAMSLAQITQLQALPAGNPNRLLAVGKYQLIPGTMKDAIAKLGLGLDRMLTPDLQETLFRSYLVAIKRPQVKSFITSAGATLAAAELALANEFASFPDPSTGNSRYGGIGGNRATVTIEEAAAALEKEQASYSAKVGRGMPPDQAWIGLSA